MTETTFLVEVLADRTRREWLMAGKPYTDTSEQRTPVMEAINEMHWQWPDQPMPMSPGLLLQEVTAQLSLKLVAQTRLLDARDSTSRLRLQRPLSPRSLGELFSGSIKARRQNNWWTLYLLSRHWRRGGVAR
jgi:hypothetical protein